MEAKLIKHGHSYALLKDGKMVAFAHPEDFSNDHMIGKLSLKNCEAIENGYDLDELLKKEIADGKLHPNDGAKKEGIARGIELALSILGDKKFSEDEMIGYYEWHKEQGYVSHKSSDMVEYIQSIQKTEWDCIVEMEYINIGAVSSYCHPKDFETEIPKLDADGCLILKRK